MRLTDKRIQVLSIMNNWPDDFWSPTEIGGVAGKTYVQASGWASGALRPLHRAGLVERSVDGHYLITQAGQEALHGVKMEESQ